MEISSLHITISDSNKSQEPLLAIIAPSAVQSSAQTFIHNAICSLTPLTVLDTIKFIA